MILKEALLHDVDARRRQWRNQKIAAIVTQHRRRRRLRWNDPQIQAAHLGRDAREEERQEKVALEIVRGDGQRQLRSSRIEMLAAREAPHLVDQGTRPFGERMRMGRGNDAAPRLGKQRIAHDPPQLLQAVADRGLGQPQPRRR
jgi:hypothetical protein